MGLRKALDFISGAIHVFKAIERNGETCLADANAPIRRLGASEFPEYFVDATEAAKFLGLNHRTLMKMAREGSVPAHPIGDGARKLWRFLLSELDEWLRARINSACRPCSPNRRNAQ